MWRKGNLCTLLLETSVASATMVNYGNFSKFETRTTIVVVAAVHLLSHIQLFVTPWIKARQASLSFTISHSLFKLMSIESVMPSNHLILCHILSSTSPLPSIFPSIRVFSNQSALCIRWPNYWSFSFSISPSNEYSGLISFRIDFFDLFQSKGLSRVFSNTTA